METICMKCQICLLGKLKKKKKITNFLSAELAKRVVKANINTLWAKLADNKLMIFFLFFPENKKSITKCLILPAK